MLARYGKIGLAALSLTALGLVAFPMHASAQDNKDGDPASGKTEDPANKKIDLDLESTNLYYGLKLLFSQIKANFTIDESLKSLTVTAHLSQVPFRVALETLLKSTSTPLTYKVESGIYSVVPKVEEPAPTPDNNTTPTDTTTTSNGYKFGFIRPNNLSALDIVQAFKGVIVTVGYGGLQNGQNGQGGIGGGLGGGGLGGFGGGGIGGGLGGGFGGGGFGGGGLGGGGYGGGGYGGGGYGGGGYGGGGLGGGRGGGGYGGGRGGF